MSAASSLAIMEKYPKKVLRVAMQCEILILVAGIYGLLTFCVFSAYLGNLLFLYSILIVVYCIVFVCV